MIFAALTIVHLAANYFAVKALVFSHLNNSRLAIILRTYLRYDAVPNPRNVNEKESVIVGLGMSCKFLNIFFCFILITFVQSKICVDSTYGWAIR